MSDKLSRRDFLKTGGLLLGSLLASKVEKTASENELRFPLIIGVAFLDANRNGIWSQENAPIGSIPVSLIQIEQTNGSGRVVATTETNDNGVWFFQNIEPGLYRVSVDVQESSQGLPREIGINPTTKVVFGGIHGIRPEDLPKPPEPPQQPKPQPPPSGEIG